jgi:hypothetical protein
LFWSHKIHKGENYFNFEILKKFVCQFSNNCRTFHKNNCHKALKNMDLGYVIQDPEKLYFGTRIPDPGGQKDTGSRIRNTAVLPVLFV